MADEAESEEFFTGSEAEERFEAGLRACMGLPPADAREAAIRKDIYDRNAPTPSGRR